MTPKVLMRPFGGTRETEAIEMMRNDLSRHGNRRMFADLGSVRPGSTADKLGTVIQKFVDEDLRRLGVSSPPCVTRRRPASDSRSSIS